MKRPLLLILFFLILAPKSQAQSNFLVSCPAEIKMNGMQNYFFISHHSYLIYSPNSSILKLVVKMNELSDQKNIPLPGQEIEYNSSLEDSNSLVFEGAIAESKIRPGENLKDTYTFAVTGSIKFRGITYITEVICSYGAKMIRNSSQISLNLNFEIQKMDYPMYIPLIKQSIDNIKLEIIDGTVNMVQN